MAFKLGKLRNWFFWTGLALLFLGASFAVGNQVWYRTRTWWAADKPLDLRAGPISTQEFKINVNEKFLIMLEVDRDAPPDISKKVLGIVDPGSENRAQIHGARIQWTALEGGGVIQRGLSDGNGEGYWSHGKGRILGWFVARKGHVYRVDLNVWDDGNQLNPYHPHLKVEVDPFTLDGYAMGEGFAELAGFIVGGIGALLLAPVFPLWGWLVTQKAKRSQPAQNSEH